MMPVHLDVDAVISLIRQGKVRAAVAAYGGDLLPGTNSPALTELAEYVAVARRTGKDWYVGAMSNWTARDLEIDLSFLPSGNFTMDAYQDGVNADRMASDYKKTTTTVTKATKLKVHLAPGGGWAARIHP